MPLSNELPQESPTLAHIHKWSTPSIQHLAPSFSSPSSTCIPLTTYIQSSDTQSLAYPSPQPGSTNVHNMLGWPPVVAAAPWARTTAASPQGAATSGQAARVCCPQHDRKRQPPAARPQVATARCKAARGSPVTRVTACKGRW
ncbi:hypothetical protein BHM03_00011078 [Ensete ventricosum]|nr:hypothetical protein BHM03_00011078 [Ensete ventricosum]